MTVLKYTLKQYAILTTLIQQNGVLYLQGSKVKLKRAIKNIEMFKKDGIISYDDMNVIIERREWNKSFEIHLKNFKYNKFIVMDIMPTYVIIKLNHDDREN